MRIIKLIKNFFFNPLQGTWRSESRDITLQFWPGGAFTALVAGEYIGGNWNSEGTTLNIITYTNIDTYEITNNNPLNLVGFGPIQAEDYKKIA